MSSENNENVTMVQCPFCAEKINAFAKKCRYCGEVIDPALRMMYDTKLHNNSKINVNIVPESNITIPTVYPKQRLAYILLGIFLGCLGIHNFYVGYSGKGIAQLLITLLTGWLIIPYIAVFIWCIVEICVVDRDVNGVLFV